MTKISIPELSIPTEELLEKLKGLSQNQLVEEVLKAKEQRVLAKRSVSDISLYSRLNLSQVYRIENISQVPTVKIAARYIQAVQDCVQAIKGTPDKGLKKS